MGKKCGLCAKPLESFETIHVVGEGPRCYPCSKRETADRLGIDFDEPPFQPIVLEDGDGAAHTFTIRSLFVPAGLELEALEIVDEDRAGYRFAVLGDVDVDPSELFQVSVTGSALAKYEPAGVPADALYVSTGLISGSPRLTARVDGRSVAAGRFSWRHPIHRRLRCTIDFSAP